MKIIIDLVSIVIIILVTLPVFKFERISAKERHQEIRNLEYRMRSEIKRNFNESSFKKIDNLIYQYLLKEMEIHEFIDYVKVTGRAPEKMQQRILKNPKLYRSLRYDRHVDFISSNRDKNIQYLRHLKINILLNLPDLLIEKIYDDYKSLNMNELVSLENYYALQAMLRNYYLLYMNNPVGWTIKRALYSLVIRQYSPKLISTFSKTTCFTEIPKSFQFIINLKSGRRFSFSEFIYCIGRNTFQQRLKRFINSDNIKSTSHSKYIKVVITDPRAIVNLEEMLNGEDREEYVILPSTQMVVETRLLHYKTVFGSVKSMTVKTVPVEKNSEWLATMANDIENYREMAEKFRMN